MAARFICSLILFFTAINSWAGSHGLTFDLNQGLGYTYLGERLWGGLTLNMTQRRFVDNQLVVEPRIYANYDFNQNENVRLFVGLSYEDDFGLRRDQIINKQRIFALTGGPKIRVNDQFLLSTWVNIWAIHENVVYDSVARRQKLDSSFSNQSFLGFGGLMLTYLF